jgi:hypothetical protein
VGFRLDHAAIDWEEVTGLVVESYRLVAPKRMVAEIDEAS